MRTLNTSYQRHYAGLGDVTTTYPVSAFITHLLYLKGTSVHVDIERITVSARRYLCLPSRIHCYYQSMGVKCVEVEGVGEGTVPKFEASGVLEAILELLEGERDT